MYIYIYICAQGRQGGGGSLGLQAPRVRKIGRGQEKQGDTVSTIRLCRVLSPCFLGVSS